MSDSKKKSKFSTSVVHIPWTNLRENPAWFNYPLDCFLMQEQVEGADDEKATTSENSKLVMFCAKGSDLWQRTSYGFRRDSAHAFLAADLLQDRAIEVGFSIFSFKDQFDQAGILVRENEDNWIKAGVELADGVLHLSVVATRAGFSDWSTSALPSAWDSESKIIVQVSRKGDALIVKTILAETKEEDEGEWRLMRVCPMPVESRLHAGPYSCAPSRDGLFVEFFHYAECDAQSLH